MAAWLMGRKRMDIGHLPTDESEAAIPRLMMAAAAQSESDEDNEDPIKPSRTRTRIATMPRAANSAVSFGTFQNPDLDPAQRTGVQKYAWVTSSCLSDRNILEDILDVWELDPPTLVITLTAAVYPHMNNLFDESGLQDPAIAKSVSDVLEVLREGEGGEAGDDSRFDARIVETLGLRLRERLVSTFVSLLDACSRTGSWLVIQEGPNTAQLLLEEALAQTSSRPIILVVANSNDRWYRSEKQSLSPDLFNITKPAIQKQDEAWDSLRDFAVPASEYAASSGQLVCLPEGLKGKWQPDTASVAMAEKQVSLYHPYSYWPFAHGTHYIFFEGSSTGEACGTCNAFSLEWLGPVGMVAMNLGGGTIPKVLQSIEKGCPTIILHHSGKGANFVGHLYNAIVQSKKREVADVLDYLRKQRPSWKKEGDDVFGVFGLRKQVFQYIDQMLNLHWNTNRPLEHTVRVVDVWKQHAADVLLELSSTFSSVGINMTDVVDGNSERDTLENALEWQLMLSANSRSFDRWANTLHLCGLFLSLSSTSLSILSTFFEDDGFCTEAHSDYVFCWDIGWALILLPALSGLMTALLSRLRYVEKWGMLHLAAAEIESESYKFRTKACEYDLPHIHRTSSGRSGRRKRSGVGSELKQRPENSTLAGHGRIARTTFSEATAGIFSGAVSGDMQSDALTAITADDLRRERDAVVQRKRARICQEGHQQTDVAGPGNPKSLLLLEQGEMFVQQAQGMAVDDLISPLSVDAYYSHRVESKLNEYMSQAPWMRCKVTCYQVFIFLSSVLGTVLSTLGGKRWLPIMVNVTSVLTTLLLYEALEARLCAMNNAIREMQRVRSRWLSMGVVERCMPSSKTMMVTTVENAIMAVVVAYTGGFSSRRDSSKKVEAHHKECSSKSSRLGRLSSLLPSRCNSNQRLA